MIDNSLRRVQISVTVNSGAVADVHILEITIMALIEQTNAVKNRHAVNCGARAGGKDFTRCMIAVPAL